MLEDDQRFEELESKLAALSSQVEGLELDTELNPFSEDDVRRTVEYFKNLELEGLESEDFGGEDDFDDDESSSSEDFISVQTTGGPSFKTHWISPDSCEDMTLELARAAFIQGAADRYGTSLQINNGDVLILLCREAVEEEPEEGSEPVEPSASKEICRYIGLAYNTLIHPASAEPTSETEEAMSATVGNYEIFVWSSCECSDSSSDAVILPSGFEVSSESKSHGSYASIGGASSADSVNLDGLLTEAYIRKSDDTSQSSLAKGLSNELAKTKAGYKTELVQLSQELSRYYVDQKKATLAFNADKKSLNTNFFESDNYTSKNISLSNDTCGNLSSVSIAGETFNLSLLKEGSAGSSFDFLTTAKISLGSAVSISSASSIDFYDTNAATLDELDLDELVLDAGSTVFLPTVSDANANLIQPTANLNYLLKDLNVSIDAIYSVINEDSNEGDAEYSIYQTKTKLNALTWASGLLTDSGTEETLQSELVGVIRVKNIPIKYSCDPVYGCIADPAGDYDDPTCGGNCESDENSVPLLTFRPSKIYRLDQQSGRCLILEEYTRVDAPTGDITHPSTPSTQSYVSDSVSKLLEKKPLTGENVFNNSVLNEVSDLPYYASSSC
jgi:hypothetical protein